MRKWLSAFTLIELLVVIAIIAILLQEQSNEPSGNCQPVKPYSLKRIHPVGNSSAWIYMIPDDDTWTTQATYPPNVVLTGARNTTAGAYHNSNASLAVLYPKWLDDERVFGCPSTTHKPKVIITTVGMERKIRFTSFLNDERGPCYNGTGNDGYSPTANSSQEIDPRLSLTGQSPGKCSSYTFDDVANFREMKPNSARGTDHKQIRFDDGKVYSPHETDGNGINVMHYDGRVTWADDNFVSDNPLDNIFKCQLKADWISLDSDSVCVRTHGDGLVEGRSWNGFSGGGWRSK